MDLRNQWRFLQPPVRPPGAPVRRVIQRLNQQEREDTGDICIVGR